MISEPYPSISRSSPQNVADESRRFPALATPVWVFNESEKAELPAAFESVAKEAFPGVLLVRKTEEPDEETAKRNLHPRGGRRAEAHLTFCHWPLPLPRQHKIEAGYSFRFYLSHLDQQVGPE
jgi:hypothetical protein